LGVILVEHGPTKLYWSQILYRSFSLRLKKFVTVGIDSDYERQMFLGFLLGETPELTLLLRQRLNQSLAQQSAKRMV